MRPSPKDLSFFGGGLTKYESKGSDCQKRTAEFYCGNNNRPSILQTKQDRNCVAPKSLWPSAVILVHQINRAKTSRVITSLLQARMCATVHKGMCLTLPNCTRAMLPGSCLNLLLLQVDCFILWLGFVVLSHG